jgi:hypothetical protein
MNDVVDTRTTVDALDCILGALRLRLVEVEAWADGAVKAVAQEAVRQEMTRVARQRLELEWRWA